MAFINGIQGVLSIAVMLAIGYFLAHKGWLDEQIVSVFSKILINISLPGLMLYNILGNFDKDKLISSGTGFIIAFLSIAISMIVGRIFTMLFKVDNKKRGISTVMFALSNTMFIGLPVNLALFGEKGVPYLLIYYLANTSIFWTIGNNLIRMDSFGSNSIFNIEGLRKLLSPPLITFLISIVFAMLNIKLPAFLMDVFKYMGNLSTPMSMLLIGAIIYSMGFKEITLSKEMLLVLTGRFLVTPILVVFFLKFLPVPDLMGKVFIIQSSMPVITQSAVSARAYEGDYRFAASAITLSTLLSLFLIPLYMYLMG